MSSYACLSNSSGIGIAILRLMFPTKLRSVFVFFLVLAATSFLSGFYFGGQKVDQSGVPRGFRAERRGEGFCAVKHRGGENPPSFEITAEQYRLWKQGESIHALFHFGAGCCFLVAWVMGAFLEKRRSRR